MICWEFWFHLKSGLGSDREERREQIELKYLKWNEKEKEKKEKE
jgi:hypothetical protein